MTTSAPPAKPAGRGGTKARGPGDPGSRVPGEARPLAAAGVGAACTAAGLGLAVLTILVVIGWVAAPHPGAGLLGVLRTAAVLWLVAHHVTVQVSGAGRIGMLPLGLVLLPGTLLWRAGRSLVRAHAITGLRPVIGAVLAVAIPYAVLAGVLALISRSSLATASVPEAVGAAFVVAFAATGLGAARALAKWSRLGTLVSPASRSIMAGSACGLAVLIGTGAMVTALALAGDVHKFAAVYQLLGPGVVGAVLLFLAQLAYLPNAVIWAVAYMLGPGFAVGTGTVVAPTGSVVGPLPALPLLAVLPAGSHAHESGWLAWALLAVPYLAGAVGGLTVARLAPTSVLEAAPIRGFCCGALAGGALGLASAFAGGPLGDSRLSAVGPSAWQVTLIATLEIGIAAAITAGAANWWQVRRHWVAAAAEGWTRPATADEADGHVVYLDRWAQDKPADSRPRPRGPADLP